MAGKPITTRSLNRALLARQGLIERLTVPLVEAVEAVGALQAQSWTAPGVALWSRVEGLRIDDLHGALDDGSLVNGTLLRATLHVVSARQHPDYARVAVDSGVCDWHRAKGPVHPDSELLRPAVAEFAAGPSRSVDEISAFADSWAKTHDDAISSEELRFQQDHKWRPVRAAPFLVRVPVGSGWTKEPKNYRAAPEMGDSTSEFALDAVVGHHLRAFGPASVDDIAYWTGAGTPVVRKSLVRLGDRLVELADENGAVLHDLEDAPRPAGDTPVAPRFLAAFDSALLAYHAKRRERILPEAHREAVSVRPNLQIKPTFLIDGLVAGLWAAEAKRKTATLTLSPFDKLRATDRKALTEEGEQLLAFLYPEAVGYEVAVA
ncbi:MAG: winged helix DNA-binding domain-containing protein [Umezawaea sp.]